jgi:putative transport protein
MFLVIITGILFGYIRFGKFQFGISGTLFTGLFFGWLAFWVGDRIPETDPAYDAVQSVLSNTLVSNQFFDLFLIIFIASVGLLASKDIVPIMKKYGFKFVVIGILTTFIGFAMTYTLTLIFTSGTVTANAYQVSGVYTGALTSSPGLAAAMETSKRESAKVGEEYLTADDYEKQEILDMISPNQKLNPSDVLSLSKDQIAKYAERTEIDVGIGHAVAYPFGVMIVILTMNLFPRIFKIRIEDEWKKYNSEIYRKDNTETAETVDHGTFNMIAFFIVAMIGSDRNNHDTAGSAGYIRSGFCRRHVDHRSCTRQLRKSLQY